MPDSGEGTFDGDGSVKWQVVTDTDDDHQGGTNPQGPQGRKSYGVDKDCKTYFRVVLKVPQDPVKAQAFLSQFASFVISGNTVEVRLPIEQVSRQITIKWDANGPVRGGASSV